MPFGIYRPARRSAGRGCGGTLTLTSVHGLAEKNSHCVSHMAGAIRHVFANRRKEMTMTPRLNPFTASPAAMES
jgi:hypothetical protein